MWHGFLQILLSLPFILLGQEANILGFLTLHVDSSLIWNIGEEAFICNIKITE